MIEKLDFIGVPSQDTERSRRFERETLGPGPTRTPRTTSGR